MVHKDLNRRPTNGQQAETLDQTESRIKKRNWKHLTIAATIGAATIFGMVEAGKEVSESDLFSRKPTKDEKLAFGMLWFLGSTILGGAGAVTLAPRLIRNQNSLERIDESRRAGCVKRVVSSNSPYRRGKDGLMETFGEAAQRFKNKLTTEFTAAASLAIAGTAMIVDAAFADQPILTNAVLPVLKNMNVATTFASISETIGAAVALGTATAFTVAGIRHKAVLGGRIKDDIAYHGEYARPESRFGRTQAEGIGAIVDAKLE